MGAVDLNNWVVLTNYGKIIAGCTQGETKDEAIKQCVRYDTVLPEEAVAVQGAMIWIQGRVVGIELKDGTKIYGHENKNGVIIDLSKIAKYVQYYDYGNNNKSLQELKKLIQNVLKNNIKKI